MLTLHYGTHEAVLSEAEGLGMLITPDPARNVFSHTKVWPEAEIATGIPGARPASGGSVHAADWTKAIEDLAARGWEPVEDRERDGLPLVIATSDDGRTWLALTKIG